MQHSLRYRFRGAFLGAALGETLGMNCADRLATQLPLTWVTVHRWGFQRPLSAANVPCRNAMPLAIAPPSGDDTDKATTSVNLTHPIDRLSPASLVMSILPIALFYHEDWHQLQQHLEQTVKQLVSAAGEAIWTPTPARSSTEELVTAALVMSYGLVLALRERLYPSNLLARLMIDLDLQDRHPLLMQQLDHIQSWLQQGTDLSRIQSMLKRGSVDPAIGITALTLALYGFLSTPTNFRLSLLRTAQLRCQPQATCSMVGALSGVYNSVSGLPLPWLQRGATESALAWKGGIASEFDVLKQADLLWATWSGADNPDAWLSPDCSPVTASPHVIRSHLD
jgi:hypothetical protein